MIKETKYTSNGLSVPIHCQKYKRPISYPSSKLRKIKKKIGFT